MPPELAVDNAAPVAPVLVFAALLVSALVLLLRAEPVLLAPFSEADSKVEAAPALLID